MRIFRVEPDRFRIGLPVQQVEATGNFIVVRGLGRELDLAATAETAGDLLLLHDALHRIHSGIIGMIRGAGLVHAQTLGETAEIDRRAVVDVAAVAARGAADDAISLQHHNTGATPGQRKAAESPVKPPPITATSVVSGNGPGRRR